MKIAVTGATGYIGRHFSKLAIAAGHQIVALTRRSPAPMNCEWLAYTLLSAEVPILPWGVDAVVHLAGNTSGQREPTPEQELAAAELLIKAARAANAKFVYVSSQTAQPDAPSEYGRTKWRIERSVLAANGYVIRPGQVYGGVSCGLFGDIVKMVQRLLLLPRFLPAPTVQPIHVDDLAQGMLRVVERNFDRALLCLASPDAVSFTNFMRALALHRLRVVRIFVPIPRAIIFAVLSVVGRHAELARLRSLFALPRMRTATDLQLLEVNLRPLASGMHPAGDSRRRELMLEGRALWSYVLRGRPTIFSLRRYVRAVERLRTGAVLTLPHLFLRWPILIAFIDVKPGKNEWQEQLLWRLDAVTALAEASPQGARRFLGLERPHSFFRSAFRIAYALSAEGMWRLVRLSCAPLASFIARRG